MGLVSRDILLNNIELQEMAKAAMADWVQTLGQWKLFITVTMAPPIKSFTGVMTYDRRGSAFMRRSWERFVEMADSILGSRTSYFAVVEKHKSGIPHMHALLGYSRGYTPVDDGALPQLARELKEASSRAIGWTRCDVLVPEKGAEYYVCKYVVKSDELWEYRE